MKNTDLSKESQYIIIKKYKKVLKGKYWDTGYWKDNKGKERAKICIRYLFLDILKWEDKEFENRLTKAIFIKYKLGNMLNKVFNGDIYEAIITAIPEKEAVIKGILDKPKIIEEFKENIDKALHNSQYRKECLIKIIDLEGYDINSLDKQLNSYTLIEYGFEPVFKTVYKSSMFNVVNEITPNKYLPWCFINKVILDSNEIKECWSNKDNRLEALLFVAKKAKDKNKKTTDIRASDFDELGLQSLLDYYNKDTTSFYRKKSNNVFPIFEEFLPKKARPWMFEESGDYEYWQNNPDISKEAINYILDLKSYSLNEANLLTIKDFADNYLDTMLNALFNGSVYEAINSIAPNKFSLWDFKDIPYYIWNSRDKRKEGLTYLLKKLDIDISNLSQEKDNILNRLSP